MNIAKRVILNISAVLISIFLVMSVSYWVNSEFYISADTVESMDGGLGVNGEDMSYTWEVLPANVLPGDRIEINFNNGEVDYVSECEMMIFHNNAYNPELATYSCQATWPIEEFYKTGEDHEYRPKDAYNKDYYTFKTRMPVARYFKLWLKQNF